MMSKRARPAQGKWSSFSQLYALRSMLSDEVERQPGAEVRVCIAFLAL